MIRTCTVLSTDIFIRLPLSLVDSVRLRRAICASKSYGDCNEPSSLGTCEANCVTGVIFCEKSAGGAGSHQSTAQRRKTRESWMAVSSELVL